MKLNYSCISRVFLPLLYLLHSTGKNTWNQRRLWLIFFFPIRNRSQIDCQHKQRVRLDIRWRKIRWRLFFYLIKYLPILVFHEFFCVSSTHNIYVVEKTREIQFHEFFCPFLNWLSYTSLITVISMVLEYHGYKPYPHELSS